MKIFLILFLSVLITNCNDSDNTTSQSEKSEDQVMMMKMGNDGSGADVSAKMRIENIDNVNKKIIKTGNISFETPDLENSKIALDKIIKNNKCYYSTESFSKSDFRNSYNLDIRIPSEKFDLVISEISKIDGFVTQQNISSNDVTSEYLDYEIRLANKTAYLEKFREILKQAKSIQDVLNVQDKIRVIEEELESVKGRLKYLSEQVAYSTLNLDIYQVVDSSHRADKGFFERLWSSITNGWSGLTEFVLIFVMLWPFIIIGLVLFIIFYKWVRKK